MPTEFWYPISGATHDLPGGNDGWTLGAGANKNAATRPGGGRAGPLTHDDGTTYIQASSSVVQALNIDWPSPIASLTGVMTAGTRDATSGASTQREAKFINAAGALGGTAYVAITDASGSYADHSADVSNAATYRPGGGSWLVSDFDDEQSIFARMEWLSGATVFVTSAFGTLGYEPPSGGFAFLLNLAGLGALPLVGTLTDFAHFRRYLAWRERFHPRHTCWADRAEIERAWRDVRAYRHPRFFIPAVA